MTILAALRPRRFARALPVALLPLALAACGDDTGGPVKSASASRAAQLAPPQAMRHPLPPSAHVMTMKGLEGVIGADTGELTRLFGAPRLDVLEGDARKLQFAGEACVLDIYLYPPSTGAQPRATYVDARRGDGPDVDRAECVAALKRR